MFGLCEAHFFGVLDGETLFDHEVVLAIFAEGGGICGKCGLDRAKFFGGGDDAKEGYASREVESDHRDERQHAERTIEHDACSFSRGGLLVGDLIGDGFGNAFPEGDKVFVPCGGEFTFAEFDVMLGGQCASIDFSG